MISIGLDKILGNTTDQGMRKVGGAEQKAARSDS
jgi:hypothetical protein